MGRVSDSCLNYIISGKDYISVLIGRNAVIIRAIIDK